MKSMFKKTAACALILTLILSMAACGKKETASEHQEGQVVVNIDWPVYVDPGVASKDADMMAAVNMYDSLTFPNNDGTISPLVAESWESDSEGRVYTFYLRDDVLFHSGNKLTAEDVKFTMDRMLAMGEGLAYLYHGVVSSTEVLDEHTVKFTLNEPSGTFPTALTRLYILDSALVKENIDPSGSYGEFGDYGKAWLTTNDAGSGPYKIKEMRTEEYVLMEQSDNYWREIDENAPKEAKLLGGVVTSTMKTMVSRGELDVTDTAQTPETLDSMVEKGGASLVRVLNGGNFNISLNTQLAPTDDVHFRRAMAYALDYDTVNNDIYVGSIKPTGPIISGMASALSEDENPYKYDIDKAMEELKQSPYYDQLTSGEMKVNLSYCTEGGEQQEKLALLMQAGMSQLGVTVEITGKPFATMMTDASTVESTPNASFVSFNPAYADGGPALKPRYHSSSCGTWEQMEWLQDSEIDKLIEEAMATVDEDSRNEKYKEISRKLVDLCPTIWASDLAASFVYRSDYIEKMPVADDYESGTDSIYPAGYQMYFMDFRL